MLVYHFGTRDRLLREVLAHARTRQLADFRGLLEPTDEPYPRTLETAWRAISRSPYLRLFGQLPENAVHRLRPGFRREATTDWLGPLEDGLRSIGRPELATLVLAVVRGLLMDLDATGDTERADAAFAEFVAGLEVAA